MLEREYCCVPERGKIRIESCWRGGQLVNNNDNQGRDTKNNRNENMNHCRLNNVQSSTIAGRNRHAFQPYSLGLCKNYCRTVTVNLHPPIAFEHEGDWFAWLQQRPTDIILF